MKEKETTELCVPNLDHPYPYSERESEFLEKKSRERLEKVLRASAGTVPLQDTSIGSVFLSSNYSFDILEPDLSQNVLTDSSHKNINIYIHTYKYIHTYIERENYSSLLIIYNSSTEIRNVRKYVLIAPEKTKARIFYSIRKFLLENLNLLSQIENKYNTA